MCFSWAYALHLLILFVLIAGTVAIIKILVPWICGLMGLGIPDPVIRIINILILMIVIIAVIVFVASVLSCIWSSGFTFLR